MAKCSNVYAYTHILEAFAYVFAILSAYSSTIMVDEWADDAAKTHANAYDICVYVEIFEHYATSLIVCSHPIHPSLMHKPASRLSGKR